MHNFPETSLPSELVHGYLKDQRQPVVLLLPSHILLLSIHCTSFQTPQILSHLLLVWFFHLRWQPLLTLSLSPTSGSKMATSFSSQEVSRLGCIGGNSSATRKSFETYSLSHSHSFSQHIKVFRWFSSTTHPPISLSYSEPFMMDCECYRLCLVIHSIDFFLRLTDTSTSHTRTTGKPSKQSCASLASTLSSISDTAV